MCEKKLKDEHRFTLLRVPHPAPHYQCWARAGCWGPRQAKTNIDTGEGGRGWFGQIFPPWLSTKQKMAYKWSKLWSAITSEPQYIERCAFKSILATTWSIHTRKINTIGGAWRCAHYDVVKLKYDPSKTVIFIKKRGVRPQNITVA